MVLAHLRGLLKPDYAHGAMSIIREELVLQALAQETEGHALQKQAQMAASMIPAVDPKERQRAVRSALDNMRMGTALLRMESYTKMVRQFKANSLDANIAALKMLQHTEVFDVLRKNLERELPNARV